MSAKADSVYGTEGREFESLRARRKKTPLRRGFFISGSARGRALRVLVQTEVRTSAGAIVAARADGVPALG